ncbi:MAG: class I SAM-dependent methyltransferase [Candidatus Brennerbacteria bacterium]|nr:class I SAM-dependent methyltransferase [Candidatus Brennerbacteria bacterium]
MFDFDKATENVGGWLTEAEGLSLYNAAKKIKHGNVVVEIGSWKGKSTICLGNGSKDGNKVKIFAVDPHIGSSEHQKMFNNKVDTFEEFKQNINRAGIAEFVEPIRDTSENAARNFSQKIEFIFIDGAHEYSFVRLDFRLWFPRVMNNGVLAFHDSWHFIGPNLATAIPLLTSSKIKNPHLVDTTTYFEKVEKNSLFDRLKNIIFVIYRTLFGISGFLRLKYQGSKVI